jgi:N-acetylglucosaminyldiphosphoundecaprenol N-acetyl-beta-D-mannosaminyltransferase
MIDYGKHNILGVNIAAVDYEAAVERILAAARAGQAFSVSALAVHGVMTGVLDAAHRFRLNQFDLLVPDGQPVRWALKWLHGVRLPQRVYGPTLMLEVCRQAAEEGVPIYLFGSSSDMLAALQARLVERFPKLQIAGMRPSQFRKVTADERDELAAAIRASGARIAFVGLGCPRQEVWTYEHRAALDMPVIAVGAAFAFHAGRLPQAPQALQDRGLEWLYRLVQEPKRLWRRYLYLNPMYLSLLGLQWARLRRFSPEVAEKPTQEMLFG